MKKILPYLLAGSLYLAGCSPNDLTKEDFNKAKWVKHSNPDGIIWDEYMDSRIQHNQNNWYLYNYAVNEKNKGNLEGEILIPEFKDSKKK